MDYGQIVEKFYGRQVDGINLLESHFGTEIYRVTIDGDAYILKSLPLYMDGAKREGQVVDFLRRNGLKVSRFLKTYQGGYAVTTDTCIVTLQEYIKGMTLQINEAPDWFMEESPRLLGKIQLALRNYKELPVNFGADFFAKDNVLSKKRQYESDLLAARKGGIPGWFPVWRSRSGILQK